MVRKFGFCDNDLRKAKSIKLVPLFVKLIEKDTFDLLEN